MAIHVTALTTRRRGLSGLDAINPATAMGYNQQSAKTLGWSGKVAALIKGAGGIDSVLKASKDVATWGTGYATETNDPQSFLIAVGTFQKQYGLDVDGQLGPGTWGKIQSKLLGIQAPVVTTSSGGGGNPKPNVIPPAVVDQPSFFSKIPWLPVGGGALILGVMAWALWPSAALAGLDALDEKGADRHCRNFCIEHQTERGFKNYGRCVKTCKNRYGF